MLIDTSKLSVEVRCNKGEWETRIVSYTDNKEREWHKVEPVALLARLSRAARDEEFNIVFKGDIV